MFRRLRISRAARKDERKSSTSSEATAVGVGTSELTSSAVGCSRSPSPSPSRSGWGLRVLHQPAFASLDIIFVHGLGGHSERTWSKDHNASLFWPQSWLPFEPDVGMSRIMTFGYNANFRGTGAKSISNILDFAKDLLAEMHFAKDGSGSDLGLGSNPLIFVVHSMGGLVVKKACLLGIHDENYKHIINSISAIVFLSTPHRGTHLADTLNRVLAASFQTPKNFISDLRKSSPAIEELNEQFRHFVSEIKICSFYETLETPIGHKKILILDKDSSVLGYPSEISRPLQADHHDVCKFASAADPNYISVRNAIQSLVGLARSKMAREAVENDSVETTDIQELFHNCPTSEADFNTIRRYWIPGSCSWFLQRPEVESWIKPSPNSSILWCTAPPASGKSVLSTFMISHLKSTGLPCHYFLFKYSDHSKRSVANCLRALALQTAKDNTEFRKLLSQSSSLALALESADVSLLWMSLFEKLLFRVTYGGPIYWVIDALDECDSPKHLLECLRGLPSAKAPIRVLVMSRRIETISVAFDRLSYDIKVSRIDKSRGVNTKEDIDLFVTREVKHLRGSDYFKESLKRTMIERSNGNFLWSRLVLDEIRECHTEESTREILETLPDDMMQLYQRMESTMTNVKRRSNEELIRTLLEWAVCAQRSLSLKELSHALRPEFSNFLDLERTITEACGHFVHIDEEKRVGILHHTAREYLTTTKESKFYINTRATHEKLFLKALSVLRNPELRWELMHSQHTLQTSEPFIFYAAMHWPFHLQHSHSTSSKTLDLLTDFFRGSGVLAWIYALALLRRLDVLVKAARCLEMFVRNIRKRNQLKNPLQHRLSDIDLIEAWIVDLIKITGKFGQHIVAEPSVIYNVIPSLSPRASTLHEQFYDEDSSLIKVHGTREGGWTDHLGRLDLPSDSQAWTVSCAAKFIAVLSSSGAIHIWDSLKFMEVIVISHGEPITAMAMTVNGARLATYGLSTTKIWPIPSGKPLLSTENPAHVKAMAISFAESDSKLIMGGDDNVIRHILCHNFDSGWQMTNDNLLQDTARIEGAVVNSPVCLAFSGDNTLVGVSYRGAPLSVWNIAKGRCINRCKRAKSFQSDHRRPSQNWFAVDTFTWNPVTNHLLGVYKDGCIFKWHPLTEETMEAQCAADEIAASPNGKLFAVSSSNGSIKVWSFIYFSVIYQLSSEDLVSGLAFSPDNRRFYDLRGSAVNA